MGLVVLAYATHKRSSKSWASRNLSLICYSFLYCLFVCVVALHGRSCDLLGKILVVVLSSSRVPHPCLYEDGDNLFTMPAIVFILFILSGMLFQLSVTRTENKLLLSSRRPCRTITFSALQVSLEPPEANWNHVVGSTHSLSLSISYTPDACPPGASAIHVATTCQKFRKTSVTV